MKPLSPEKTAKTRRIAGTLAVLLALIAWTGLVAAQPPGHHGKKGKAGWMCMHGDTMMQGLLQMMKKAGVPEQTRTYWQQMMRTPIALDGPSALRSRAEKLDLSKEQLKKLMEIETEARKQALAVLTPEQRNTLGPLPEQPLSMLDLCRQIRPKMREMMKGMMGGKGSGSGMMHCPMMRMMGMSGMGSTPSGGSNPAGTSGKPAAK